MKQRKLLGYQIVSIILASYYVFIFKTWNIYIFQSPISLTLHGIVLTLLISNLIVCHAYLAKKVLVKKNVLRFNFLLISLFGLYYLSFLIYNGIYGVFYSYHLILMIGYFLLAVINYSMLKELYLIVQYFFKKNKL
jgi:hypothetical protein